jgi:hypothetical protein
VQTLADPAKVCAKRRPFQFVIMFKDKRNDEAQLYMAADGREQLQSWANKLRSASRFKSLNLYSVSSSLPDPFWHLVERCMMEWYWYCRH